MRRGAALALMAAASILMLSLGGTLSPLGARGGFFGGLFAPAISTGVGPLDVGFAVVQLVGSIVYTLTVSLVLFLVFLPVRVAGFLERLIDG